MNFLDQQGSTNAKILLRASLQNGTFIETRDAIIADQGFFSSNSGELSEISRFLAQTVLFECTKNETVLGHAFPNEPSEIFPKNGIRQTTIWHVAAKVSNLPLLRNISHECVLYRDENGNSVAHVFAMSNRYSPLQVAICGKATDSDERNYMDIVASMEQDPLLNREAIKRIGLFNQNENDYGEKPIELAVTAGNIAYLNGIHDSSHFTALNDKAKRTMAEKIGLTKNNVDFHKAISTNVFNCLYPFLTKTDPESAAKMLFVEREKDSELRIGDIVKGLPFDKIAAAGQKAIMTRRNETISTMISIITETEFPLSETLLKPFMSDAKFLSVFQEQVLMRRHSKGGRRGEQGL